MHNVVLLMHLSLCPPTPTSCPICGDTCNSEQPHQRSGANPCEVVFVTKQKDEEGAQSKTLHRNLKCELYRKLVRIVVAYGSEAWYMIQKDEQPQLFLNFWRR